MFVNNKLYSYRAISTEKAEDGFEDFFYRFFKGSLKSDIAQSVED